MFAAFVAPAAVFAFAPHSLQLFGLPVAAVWLAAVAFFAVAAPTALPVVRLVVAVPLLAAERLSAPPVAAALPAAPAL